MTSGVYLAHAGSELRQLLRSPGYLVPTLIFPAMLFSFFGLTVSNKYPQAAPAILASWNVYAVLGVAFYQFGAASPRPGLCIGPATCAPSRPGRHRRLPRSFRSP